MIGWLRHRWALIERRWPIVGHHEGKRFIRFAVVGGLNTVADFSIFSFLHLVFHVHYLLANAISFSVAALNSYILNRRWTFRSRSAAWQKEMIQFLMVISIGFGINEGLLLVFVRYGHLLPVVSKIVATVIVLIWNYGANRFWTFRHVDRMNLPG